MINKGIALGVLALAVVGLGVYSMSASASFGKTGQVGPNYTPERHEKMQEAFANGDYTSWKAQMGDKGATRVVTADNFARFTEMHNLMVAGKTAEASAIRTELGLGQGGGKGQGMGKGQGQNRGVNFVDANGDGKCDNMR